MAEKGSHSVDEVNIVRVLTQFNVAVMKVSRVIRQMLQVFDGYECKEPEPGKLTLAFQYAPLPQCSISFRATYSTPNQQSRGPDTESILKTPFSGGFGDFATYPCSVQSQFDARSAVRILKRL